MSPSPRGGKRWAAVAFAAALALPAGAVQLAYAQAAAGSTPFMTLPFSGRISVGYGEMRDPFSGKVRLHEGVDIVGKAGANIVAPAAGRVVRAIPNYENHGNFLEIDHGDGLTTRYTHLQTIEVKQGEFIMAGQLIARVGSTGRSTGPHLHLQVLRNGKSINPADVFNLKKG
jgi:murein DD-endopeptidase MepM/ murein hydrolase activator NlpD